MISPARNISSITLPIPFELESVNVHLVELDHGFLLVDSGLETLECFEALEAGLGERGIVWSDIQLLLLTHLHPDHIGLSWKILELSGARLLMHPVEAEHLALMARDNRSPFFSQAMRNAGVPAETEARIDRAIKGVRGRFRAHEPHWKLEDNEMIPVRGGGALQVILTPGHSPGHICLYSPKYRYLISGDHLLENITPNIAWHPGVDMVERYLDSLARLEAFDVGWVVPSHGPPFRGHRERIRTMANHHAERCEVILANVSQEPMTAYQLVEAMWRELSPFHQHFAVFEVLAHLEHLDRRGQVAAEARNGGALYWKSGTRSRHSS
jgi:glyoxylase-like metal-dependent hydrolase (beta-lactamase superfamily II)